MSQDPLETEGKSGSLLRRVKGSRLIWSSGNTSPQAFRCPCTGQGRAGIYRCSRARAPEYSREHQRPSQVVEYLPAGGGYWRGCLPGVVVEEVLRGEFELHTMRFGKETNSWCNIGQARCLSFSSFTNFRYTKCGVADWISGFRPCRTEPRLRSRETGFPTAFSHVFYVMESREQPLIA